MLVPNDIMWVKVQVPLADFATHILSDVVDIMWMKVRVPLAEFALDVLRDAAISCGQKSECPWRILL